MQSNITKVYQDVIMRMLNYFSQVLLAFVFGTTIKNILLMFIHMQLTLKILPLKTKLFLNR